MTPGTAPIRLRPLSLPDLLDELFRLYRRHFAVIAGVSLAVTIPGLVLGLLSGSYRVDFGSLSDVLSHGNDPEALQAFQQRRLEQLNPGLAALSGLVGLVLIPFTVGAVFRAATAVAVGEPASVGTVLRATLARYWGLFGVVLIPGLALFGLVVVNVILAVLSPFILLVSAPVSIGLTVWVGVRWAIALPALLTERLGPAGALRRSWDLVRGFWWRTLGIVIVITLLEVVVSVAISSLFGGIAFLVPLNSDPRAALITAVNGLVGVVINPVTPVGITLLYLDLRVRKEGLDLEQLAKQTTGGMSPV